ncbi:conserved membrane hypothetical protein [uncultured Desulfobacterium sp.]|uniref:Uncharacterized protein n=1 Tax=uncultured Desulfobacterium sp. TaxID=201089 RepID=A0A445N1S1_9BACT|nr:conserved membrane hypothetical protein [uncultured Desulfobacterium sp.]
MKTLFFLILFFIAVAASAAPVPDTDTIPPSLDSWKPWVLHGEEERLCPTSYNDGNVYRCSWPSILELDMAQAGGVFTQQWLVFVKGWAELPGGNEQLPRDVKVDGKIVPVVARDNSPCVRLAPGRHQVEGKFIWADMPEMIPVPPSSGLVGLSINGRKVPCPLLDTEGRLWLQKKEEGAAQEERVDVRVCRLLNDNIPFEVASNFRISVSGRAREIRLSGVILDGFIPLNIKSPIPARLGPNNELMLQARPGRWEVVISAYSQAPVNAINPVSLPFGEEVWAFQAQNHLRMVKVKGGAPIDPNRADTPAEWKNLPTYTIKSGDAMVFEEIRRGDAEPAPDQLNLNRTWWLDFDGGGLTIQDKVQGTMSRQWYLAMNPPAMLGRVSVDGKDQLITGQGKDNKPGVELRRGTLDLVSESRLDSSTRLISAVGWDHDFESVTGSLNLPPGWRLLTASGVDVMPGTWFARWTLLDLFLVLIISLSIYKLWDWRFGLLALAAVGLTYHEPESPRIVWLHLLAATALLRFLPEGWIKRLAAIWRIGSLVTLVVFAIPFMVNQVRWGIYPQLEPHWSGPVTPAEYKQDAVGVLSSSPIQEEATVPRKGKGMAKIMERDSSQGLQWEKGESYYRQQTQMVRDPNALIQTGPGLPSWRWRSYEMKWNGPVEASQEVRLWLLSPAVNLILALARFILLAGLVIKLMDIRGWKLPEPVPAVTAAILCVLFIPSLAAGEIKDSSYPPDGILQQLKERLLEKPDCLPFCASSPNMEITLDSGGLRILFDVHASIETAVPLPGSLKLWRPEEVFMDSKPAAGLLREKDGSMWALISEGIHTITLFSEMPVGNTIEIPLPLKPGRVTVMAAGFDVQGTGPDGKVEDVIKLTRLIKTEEQDQAWPERMIPAFLKVERILSLGLTWQTSTTVTRVTQKGTPAVVQVPLLAGESVTTAGIGVEDGNVQVNMGPDVTQVSWSSTIKTQDVIELKAPEQAPWTETWILDASPIWHCEFEGIPVVHHQDSLGQWRPRWQPWPGESVKIRITRPKSIPGQSVTIDKAGLVLTPGERSSRANLSLSMRSSQGGQHKIVLPEGARLQMVRVSGKTLPVREEGREIMVPLKPGTQTVDVEWRESVASSALTRGPHVAIGEQAVNADVTFEMPQNRWILFTTGPRLGPAVLFWSYLLIIIVVASALGRVSWTPLTTRHWLLLGLGLTQTHPLVALMIVGWFLALGTRQRYRFPEGFLRFNLSQILLIVWTIAAMVGLYTAIEKGLLGIPDMQIAGNGSYDFWLHWTQDRIGPFMPEPSVVAVPMYIYRALMLLWALWLAYCLLKWLKWGYKCFCEGGLWRKIEFRKAKI